MKRLLRVSKRIDNLNKAVAVVARWSILLMLGLGLWNVIGRYIGVAIGYNLSSNGLIEGQWYLFDIAFLLGLGWTLQHHRLAMKIKPLSIPCNEHGDTKEVETWRLNSVWPAKKPEDLVADKDKLPDYMFDEEGIPVYYHLHPELVDEKVVPGEKNRYYATICSDCEKVIESGGTPELPYPNSRTTNCCWC